MSETSLTMSVRQAVHEGHKARRAERLDGGTYGHVWPAYVGCPRSVALPAPSFLESQADLRRARDAWYSGVQPSPPLRCFYSGFRVGTQTRKAPVRDFDPRKVPLLGTKDHLIPVRRNHPDAPPYDPRGAVVVPSAHAVNATLGLAPMAVRLHVRRCLEWFAFDREETSDAAGLNLRWLIIRLIDAFRIDGRLPWSRRLDGTYWLGETSRTFMDEMFAFEQAFVVTGRRDRHTFVETAVWPSRWPAPRLDGRLDILPLLPAPQ
jgi:hypothetical protein